MSPPSHVAVIGGGVAGLTAAHTLAAGGVKITVLEASDRVGGKLDTGDLRGHAVDRGADSFLARVPDALDLCHELAIDDELVTPAERSAFLLVDGRLRRFPTGLVLGVPTDLDALEASGIISPAGITRAAEDLERPASGTDGDRSVGELTRDRLGDEVFEKLVGPLLSGVNAGDADELSLAAGAPQLAAAASEGSLIRGARRQLAAVTDPDAPAFFSLRGGTGRLIDALVDSVTSHGDLGEIALRTPVHALRRLDVSRWRVESGAGDLDVDRVVVATPAFVTAPLLEPHAPDVAHALSTLEYASVALVTFVYARADVGHPLDGSGFLVAAHERAAATDRDLLMTACSFGSSKWPHWADADTIVLRVSAGRHHDERALVLDDTALVDALHDEVADVLSIDGRPLVADVHRWPEALPQYRPGHLDRVRGWHERVSAVAPGLALAGAAYGGVGIPACIATGRAAAAAVRA